SSILCIIIRYNATARTLIYTLSLHDALPIYLAYVGMIIWIIEPMRGLGRIIVQMSTGLVSYERVADIIREEREPLTDGLLDLPRSEEHTSELQSRENLVCRLLLEKKKKRNTE